MAHLQLARIESGRVFESSEVVIDSDDEHALVDLLRRMASVTVSNPPPLG